MKLNWGHTITLAFVAFVTLIASLVYGSFKTKFDLVSKEYYKDELAYQEVIDGRNNARALGSDVDVSMEKEWVTIALPAAMEGKEVKGTVLFYCPVDASNDQRYTLRSAKDAFPLQDLKPARYKVKISWNAEDVSYYAEKEIIVP